MKQIEHVFILMRVHLAGIRSTIRPTNQTCSSPRITIRCPLVFLTPLNIIKKENCKQVQTKCIGVAMKIKNIEIKNP